MACLSAPRGLCSHLGLAASSATARSSAGLISTARGEQNQFGGSPAASRRGPAGGCVVEAAIVALEYYFIDEEGLYLNFGTNDQMRRCATILVMGDPLKVVHEGHIHTIVEWCERQAPQEPTRRPHPVQSFGRGPHCGRIKAMRKCPRGAICPAPKAPTRCKNPSPPAGPARGG